MKELKAKLDRHSVFLNEHAANIKLITQLLKRVEALEQAKVPPQRWTEEEETFLLANYEDKGVNQLVKEWNSKFNKTRTVGALKARAKKLDIF